MAAYEGSYSKNFNDELNEIIAANSKIKSMVEKTIRCLLEKPHHKAEFIEQFGYWRRHTGANKYRILFNINQQTQTVEFLGIKLKNKSTYK